MRYFLIYTVLMVLISVFLGCGTENPICTDTFCLVSRDQITGEVIEIDESKVLALIARDSQLAPAVEATPQTTPESNNTFADIISDAANGGTTYLNQTVTITASVRFNLASRGSSTSISLETDTEEVFFFITDRDNPENLHGFSELATYTFKVYIRGIYPPDEEFDDYSVFAHIVE